MVMTYSHGKSTAKVVQNDPGTWVPTVIHGHCVLRREEVVETKCSRGRARRQRDVQGVSVRSAG